MSEKLQKVLARAGLGSRRVMEEGIAAGRVSVNGKIAEVGDRVTEEDTIRVDSRYIRTVSADESIARRRVLMYHKPEGEVSTRTDPEGRPTVFDRLPGLKHGRWVAVGRLDINSIGLMLFTTDGELANRLMHPSSEIEREYAVRVLGDVTPDMLKTLRSGVVLDDGMAHFDDIIDQGGEGANHWYHVVVKEGRKREVRRLWESQGLRVSRLIRVRYGTLSLPRSLHVSHWKELDAKDIDALEKLSGQGYKSRTGLYGRGRARATNARSDTKDPQQHDKSQSRTGYLRRRN